MTIKDEKLRHLVTNDVVDRVAEMYFHNCVAEEDQNDTELREQWEDDVSFDLYRMIDYLLQNFDEQDDKTWVWPWGQPIIDKQKINKLAERLMHD